MLPYDNFSPRGISMELENTLGTVASMMACGEYSFCFSFSFSFEASPLRSSVSGFLSTTAGTVGFPVARSLLLALLGGPTLLTGLAV